MVFTLQTSIYDRPFSDQRYEENAALRKLYEELAYLFKEIADLILYIEDYKILHIIRYINIYTLTKISLNVKTTIKIIIKVSSNNVCI